MGAAARPTIVVSGLPRSGTSLVMQMLAAAGLPIHSDGERVADPDNPNGYLEHAAMRRLEADPGAWAAAEGAVVKLVAPLVDALPPQGEKRVIFVERALGEVLASQATMLARRGAPPSDADAAVATALRRAAERSRDALARRSDLRLCVVAHRALLSEPAEAAQQLAAFLDGVGPLDVDAMAAVVDPTLHRQRGATAR